jgi:hypothetical protein
MGAARTSTACSPTRWKRRPSAAKPPAAVLDFYEPEEIEALARAATDGGHHGLQPANLEPDEIEERAREDAQDAELFRLASYTGLRLGGALLTPRSTP